MRSLEKEFFIYSRCKSFIRPTVDKDFLPVCRLICHLLDVSAAQKFHFDKDQFILLACAWGVMAKSPLLNPGSQRFILVFLISFSPFNLDLLMPSFFLIEFDYLLISLLNAFRFNVITEMIRFTSLVLFPLYWFLVFLF